MSKVHKGYCSGCPFDFGKEATETAYNLGCLPSVWEVDVLCLMKRTAWACHSEPDKVCCGHAERRNLPLQYMDSVHTFTVSRLNGETP
jgi:hypothetical protein